MKTVLAIVMALVFAVGTAHTASAHSLEDVEAMLGDREMFYQPLDKKGPDFALQDAEGNLIRLFDLRGKVVVLHFIYASCPDVCPLHADRIAEVQAMVNQTPMKGEVQFISITTDPEKDIPDVLRDYGPAHGLDPVNWAFLTTTPDQAEDATRRLAEVFGHKFTVAKDGYQIHSIVTHVIDTEGGWRANFHGLRFEPTNLVVFINTLVNHPHAPEAQDERGFWDKVRELF